MEKVSLSGTWELWQEQGDKRYNMTVPGSVLSGLLENRAIPDPYYRENEYEARDLFWNDFIFERTFVVGQDVLEHRQVDLVCCGLDTLTLIQINGRELAKTNNMHRTWRFPVKEYLQSGENRITIRFYSPLKYISEYQPEEGRENVAMVPCGCMKGNQYMRKAHSMFGWDWGPQLPDAGIYREIELQAYDFRFEDIMVTQYHENGRVILRTESLVWPGDSHGAENGALVIKMQLTSPDGGVQECGCTLLAQGYIAMPAQRQVAEIAVDNPCLWWPSGYGEQPLYRLKVSLYQGERLQDERIFTIGLRTMEVSREKDRWGSEFAFCVNGQKIFARGADYIPEDCIYSRITPERMDYLLRSAVRAGYNCIRIWGGGYYPSDDFYELCDKYGLIVWQDLMYACNTYALSEEFEQNIIAETRDVVQRLRHHASLGLWCGNNEMESGWDHWPDFAKEPPKLKMDYVKIFEYILPKVIAECDRQTFYWPSSPSSGGSFDNPDDESRGDAHYWDVWHGQKPFSDYRKHCFRFCSEFGFQSFPSIKTVRSFTEPEDRNIFSKVMESHQKNGAANGKILYYISENFRYPKDFESLLYVSQVLQGIAIKSGVEHWRRNRGRCMGTLYWQINDNWPVASWSSIDYFGRWKALHYMACNFYAPCAGSILVTGERAEIYVQNEQRETQEIKAIMRLKDMDLNLLDETACQGVVSAFDVSLIGEKDYGPLLNQYGRENVFLEVEFTYADGEKQTETEVFAPYKHMNLKKADVMVKAEEWEDCFVLRLTSEVFAPFVEMDFDEKDVIFSDNFFTLSDREGKTIWLAKEDVWDLKRQPAVFESAERLLGELRIRTLRDSYQNGK